MTKVQSTELVDMGATNFELFQVGSSDHQIALVRPCNRCEQNPRYILRNGKTGLSYTIPLCRSCETQRQADMREARRANAPSEPELQFLTASTRKKVVERYPLMSDLKSAKVGELKSLIGDYNAGKVAGWLIGAGHRE